MNRKYKKVKWIITRIIFEKIWNFYWTENSVDPMIYTDAGYDKCLKKYRMYLCQDGELKGMPIFANSLTEFNSRFDSWLSDYIYNKSRENYISRGKTK